MQTLASISEISPTWGWALTMGWILYQLYNPFWETKIQKFHNDLTDRFERIEVTQVAIAEEVSGMDADEVKDAHGKEGLTTSELKRSD